MSLPSELKDQTERAHRESEKRMIHELKKIRSLQSLVQMLNWLYGFYRPVEDLIAARLTPDLFPDMQKRRRADNLLHDMQETGMPLPEPETCTDLPRIDSFSKALGALYVLEGSTLGGRIIAGMLSGQLNSDKSLGFFNSYGMETGSMWLAFKAFLERPFSAAERQDIISAANETFLTFKNWIARHELQPQL